MHNIFCLIVPRWTASLLCTCGCGSWCIDGRSDISTYVLMKMITMNETVMILREGKMWRIIIVAIYLCRADVVAQSWPPFAFPHNHKGSLSWTHLTLAHENTAHQLARCHRTAYVWPINSRCRRTADSHPRSSIPGSSTGPIVLRRHQMPPDPNTFPSIFFLQERMNLIYNPFCLFATWCPFTTSTYKNDDWSIK